MDRQASRARGVTMIEIITVVAIVGILAALAVTGVGKMRPRADFSSATNDFAAVLAEAQARAVATGGDVHVVVFDRASSPSSGYFVYEDPDVNLNLAALTVPPVAGAGDRIATSVDFVAAPFSGRVEWNATDPYPLKPPFAGATSACSFCSERSGVRMGSFAFSADGTVRFLNAEGVPQRQVAGVVSLKTADALHRSAIAVAPTTGFVGVQRP